MSFTDRPADMRYLEGRGYRLIGTQRKLAVFSLRAADERSALPGT